jgi:hypothetical protein
MGIFLVSRREKKRKNVVFPSGGPELQGICWVTKKHLVAGEEKTRLSSLLKHESFLFKGRNDIVV